MKHKLHSMFARSFALIALLTAFQLMTTDVRAQSRLIHYWSFNNYTNNDTLAATSGGCGVVPLNNRIRPVKADYSVIDTNKAQFVFAKQPGVTTGWPSVAVETICFTYLDFVAGSTINARFGAPALNGARPRNPTDSMQILIYTPTTNYQNIVLKWASINSSTTSGPRYMLFDYSLDSGATWNKQGLSILKDSVWTIAYNQTTVSVTDPLANNNPRLVFRIRDSVNNALGSGNIRYDNITVEGDTVVPSGTLVHFWHFNTFATAQHNPNFYPLAADYSIHDTSKAKVLFGVYPGTSLSNPTYFDNVALSLVAPDFDTINNNWSSVPALGVVPAGAGIRMRNPNDSSFLNVYMPSVNYKNIVFKFASETSSNASGDSVQVFSYSVDSGATWRLSGISEALDSAWQTGMPADPAVIPFRPVANVIRFTDPATNNCSKLVFRIHLVGKNHGLSGNNRFDNFSVQGDSIVAPLATITTTPAAFGPFCNTAATPISVAYTTTGVFGQPYSVQISNALGVFPANTTSNIIGTGTTSPIAAIVPSGLTPGNIYRIRVVSSYPVIYGSDNGSDITLTGVAGPITGPSTVCAGGATITLIEPGAGTWTSSNTARATVGSGTGIVTGLTAGVDTIVYTVGLGCTAAASITINPLPAAIAGTPNTCIGLPTTLTDATGTGSWSSSTPAVATIGSGTGTVNGLSVGTSVISYTIPSGCFITQPFTVNPLPSAISGTPVVCQGLTTTLSDAGGGTWSSSNTALATVGSATGIVSGVTGGIPVITYTLPTGCITTTPVTVNSVPAPITGNFNGCVGTTNILTDVTAFGAWSSSNTAVATIGSSTGILSGVTTGTSNISYTLSTGCYITQSITINPVPVAITGTAVVCAGSATTLNNTTIGGTWSSSNTALATVGSTGIVTGVAAGNPTITYMLPTGCIATKVVTVNPLPAAIGGVTSVYCIGSTATLTDATIGGTWSSSNTAVATVGSGTGIVTGISAGTAIITYGLPTGCIATLTENITSSPAPITGPANACVGATSNYSDVTAFGAWTSSNTAIATIGSGTGILTGVAAGTATITYSLSGFCQTTKTVTVNMPPAAITGTAMACAGAGTTLSDTGTGFWISSVPALATVGFSTGVVNGVAAGNPVITYTAPSGCIAAVVYTVNPLPATIGGVTSVYCIGSTAALTDASTGGTWSSSNTAVATVGSGTGVVTGISAGLAIITYMLPTGCITTLSENITSTPATITGTPTTCVSNSIAFSDSTAFGAWTSSNTAVATIGSGTGIVTGVTAGTTVITYELSPFCLITKNVTVNPLPNPITGTNQVCVGTTTTLADAGGGTWTSSIPALATVGAGTGIVSGIVAGTVNITYTLPTGCTATRPVTVNPLPVISGPASICLGLPVILSGGISGGTWSSSNTAIATVGSTTGSLSGVSLGSATITYLLPTGCMVTWGITVNPPPAPITGTMHVCAGLTTTLSDIGGGGWYTSNPAVASITFGTGIVTGISAGTAIITYSLGTTCISTATVTVNPLPAAITGPATTCPGATSTLSDVTTGGVWVSSSSALATVDGLTGVVTGVSAGTPVITYIISGTGCIATYPITVNPVSPITGLTQVCEGAAITLSDSLTGGNWTSSNTALATVGSGTGIVTGVSAGTPDITYTLPTGCRTTAIITVNPTPSAITGVTNVCVGATTTLGDVTTGGAWSSSDPAVATIGTGTGVVSGITAGTSTITYLVTTGCNVTANITVNPLPVGITGTAHACVASTSALIDSTSGGTWTSGSTAIATINPGTGVATGVTAGTSVITYTLPTGCATTIMYTVNPLPGIDTITGGGSYCAGGAGLHIGLSGSDTGIHYQLYNGITAIGTPVAGTGSALDLGTHTGTGVYTVIATNVATLCNVSMMGAVTIVINPLPNINTMTGGGHYCVGDTGVHVGLGGSDTGVHYQLFRGTTAIGSPLAGSGFPLDFGLEIVPGSYTVTATNPTSGCTSNMVGAAVVVVDTLYHPAVTISASPSATSILYGQNDTLHATVTNSGPGVTYQWLVNLTYIAGATSATYISNAYAYHDSVTCLVTSHSPCGSITSGNSIIILIANVGVKPIVLEGSNITLTPNPNKGTFTLKGTLATTNDEEVSVSITNMLGQSVYRDNIIAHNGEIDQRIQLNSSLANGMYILNMRAGTENKVFHIVIEQ